MTMSCDVAFFLPLLQSGPRLTFNTQGSAKPPPWAKSCNRFAVENSHTAQHVSHFSPITLEETPRTPTSPNAERFPASSN